MYKTLQNLRALGKLGFLLGEYKNTEFIPAPTLWLCHSTLLYNQTTRIFSTKNSST